MQDSYRIVAALALFAGSALAHPGSHSEPEQPETRTAVMMSAEAEQPTQQRTRNTPEPMKAIELPAPEVTISVDGEFRIIRANGIPEHETGTFPTEGNPNAIRPQSHEIRLPATPAIADAPIPARPEFGIAINGVIFDSGTGEFWTPEQARAFGTRSRWNYEALTGDIDLGIDSSNAHVQPTGKYHYHGMPEGLIDRLKAADENDGMLLIGWAYDGFPIYAAHGHTTADDAESELKVLHSSYRVRTGERATSPEGPGGKYDGTFTADWEYIEGLGDLDECNGRTGVTPEFPEGTYYYVVTEDFPSIPRYWRGTPAHRAGGQDEGGNRGQGTDSRRGPRPGQRGERGTRGQRPNRSNTSDTE